MSGTSKRIYWDSGVFIAWLQEDSSRFQNELKGIDSHLELLKRGELEIHTSVITNTEILKSQLHPQASIFLERLRFNRNYHWADVNIGIARIAHEIRDYYSKLQDDVGATLTTPDAIHVATAIVRKCETFYTFDAKDRPGKNRALLSTSGTVASKYFLDIQKPQPSSTPSS